MILFSFCPHPLKNEAACSSLTLIWPEVWLLPSLRPRGQRVSRNLRSLLFVHTYKISVCARMHMCVRQGDLVWGVQVPHCICLEGLRTAGRCHSSPATRVLRIERRLLALGISTFTHGGIVFPTPLSQMCYVFACACAYVCMYVHQ